MSEELGETEVSLQQVHSQWWELARRNSESSLFLDIGIGVTRVWPEVAEFRFSDRSVSPVEVTGLTLTPWLLSLEIPRSLKDGERLPVALVVKHSGERLKLRGFLEVRPSGAGRKSVSPVAAKIWANLREQHHDRITAMRTSFSVRADGSLPVGAEHYARAMIHFDELTEDPIMHALGLVTEPSSAEEFVDSDREFYTDETRAVVVNFAKRFQSSGSGPEVSRRGVVEHLMDRVRLRALGGSPPPASEGMERALRETAQFVLDLIKSIEVSIFKAEGGCQNFCRAFECFSAWLLRVPEFPSFSSHPDSIYFFLFAEIAYCGLKESDDRDWRALAETFTAMQRAFIAVNGTPPSGTAAKEEHYADTKINADAIHESQIDDAWQKFRKSTGTETLDQFLERVTSQSAANYKLAVKRPPREFYGRYPDLPR